MSVLAGLRSESSVQFLETARLLQKYTIIHMVKMPKRYIPTMADEIVNTARNVYRDVLCGNEYPSTREELEAREKHFKRALSNLRWLASQLDLAYELATQPDAKDENEKELKNFAELIATEIRLICGVLKKDEEQFSALR